MSDEKPDRRVILKSGGAAALGALAASTQASAQTTPAVSAVAHAYRAEWYDLPDDQRDPFVSWLHGAYLPRLKATAGVVWVGHYKIAGHSNEPSAPGGLRRVQTSDSNVPTGSQYVLLTAGESPETFLGWQCPVSILENSSAKELAGRVGYRQAIFIEEIHVVGPEGHGNLSPEPPPAMQLGNFNVRTPDDDFELARNYRLQRLPEVARTPGSIGARKLVSIAGWPKHGILYEFAAANTDDGLFEKSMAATRRTPPIKLRPTQEYVVHAPNAPHAGVRIWPEGV